MLLCASFRQCSFLASAFFLHPSLSPLQLSCPSRSAQENLTVSLQDSGFSWAGRRPSRGPPWTKIFPKCFKVLCMMFLAAFQMFSFCKNVLQLSHAMLCISAVLTCEESLNSLLQSDARAEQKFCVFATGLQAQQDPLFNWSPF